MVFIIYLIKILLACKPTLLEKRNSAEIQLRSNRSIVDNNHINNQVESSGITSNEQDSSFIVASNFDVKYTNTYQNEEESITQENMNTQINIISDGIDFQNINETHSKQQSGSLSSKVAQSQEYEKNSQLIQEQSSEKSTRNEQSVNKSGYEDIKKKKSQIVKNPSTDVQQNFLGSHQDGLMNPAKRARSPQENHLVYQKSENVTKDSGKFLKHASHISDNKTKVFKYKETIKNLEFFDLKNRVYNPGKFKSFIHPAFQKKIVKLFYKHDSNLCSICINKKIGELKDRITCAFISKYEMSEYLYGFYHSFSKIGEGGFGQVFSCIDSNTSKKYAVKVFQNDELCKVCEINDIKALLMLQHDQFVKLYRVFSTGCIIFMVMEYVPDALCDLECPKEAKSLIIQLLEGMQLVHDKRILHRDLKLSNVLVTNTKKIKIIDFGLCSFECGNSRSRYLIGSKLFLAPESYYTHFYSTASDLFSLGVIFHILLTDELVLHDEENPGVLDYSILKDDASIEKHLRNTIQSKELIKILVPCFRLDPSKRPTINELLTQLKKIDF